jgi:hypothetical protein
MKSVRCADNVDGFHRCPISVATACPAGLKDGAELLDCQAGVANDAAESERVYRIVTRDRQYSNAVRHHDVFALPDDLEASLLKRAHCSEMIDPGDLRQD